MAENKFFIGLDIGSTCAKTVVLDKDEKLCYTDLRPTGWSSVDTAGDILQDLIEKGFVAEDGCDDENQVTSKIVATGYGRVSVGYADKAVTEITCHGKGAGWIFKKDFLSVIDIGGQDTKIICTENGMVTDFFMNDKCSAGTGRFLEVMGNTMGLGPAEVCELARNGGGVKISSMCTVFAESEVISLIGNGESKENIAFGIVDSIADKVSSQCARLLKPDHQVCLTGGLCECAYLREKLEEKIGCDVLADSLGRYAGAIGAAMCAVRL